jgi:hypothetical protein
MSGLLICCFIVALVLLRHDAFGHLSPLACLRVCPRFLLHDRLTALFTRWHAVHL